MKKKLLIIILSIMLLTSCSQEVNYTIVERLGPIKLHTIQKFEEFPIYKKFLHLSHYKNGIATLIVGEAIDGVYNDLAEKTTSIVIYDCINKKIVFEYNFENFDGVVTKAIYNNGSILFASYHPSNDINRIDIWKLNKLENNIIYEIATGISKDNLLHYNIEITEYSNNFFFIERFVNSSNEEIVNLIKIDNNNYDILFSFKEDYYKLTKSDLYSIDKSIYIDVYAEDSRYLAEIYDGEIVNKIPIPFSCDYAFLDNCLVIFEVDNIYSTPIWTITLQDFSGKILSKSNHTGGLYNLKSNNKDIAYFVKGDWSLWQIKKDENILTISPVERNSSTAIQYFLSADETVFLSQDIEKAILSTIQFN